MWFKRFSIAHRFLKSLKVTKEIEGFPIRKEVPISVLNHVAKGKSKTKSQNTSNRKK
jgi:hypothetical protein